MKGKGQRGVKSELGEGFETKSQTPNKVRSENENEF